MAHIDQQLWSTMVNIDQHDHQSSTKIIKKIKKHEKWGVQKFGKIKSPKNPKFPENFPAVFSVFFGVHGF